MCKRLLKEIIRKIFQYEKRKKPLLPPAAFSPPPLATFSVFSLNLLLYAAAAATTVCPTSKLLSQIELEIMSKFYLHFFTTTNYTSPPFPPEHFVTFSCSCISSHSSIPPSGTLVSCGSLLGHTEDESTLPPLSPSYQTTIVPRWTTVLRKINNKYDLYNFFVSCVLLHICLRK
jgi:hypothetical protein